MDSVLFYFFPHLLDEVEIGRVGWQWECSQPCFMFLEELLHSLACVISGSVLNKDDMFLRFVQNGFHELWIDLRCQMSDVLRGLGRKNAR